VRAISVTATDDARTAALAGRRRVTTINIARALLGVLPGVLLGALTVYLAFNSGGYYPGATAIAALVLTLALLSWFAVARRPLANLGIDMAISAGALMLYGVWILLSASWSGSSARALVEFDRTLLYLLALLFFGLTARWKGGLRGLVWGVALALTVISVAGLISRILPHWWSATPVLQKERLSYPIGYWNPVGLAAALGMIFCFHLTSSEREPRVVRLLGAAALPALSLTIYFTFSRGPIPAAVIGLIAYMLIGRPRLLLTGLLAAGPMVAVALASAWGADFLAAKDPTTPQAAAQGHHVATTVGLCTLGAAGIRLILLPLDSVLARLSVPRRALRWSAVLAGVALVVGVLLAFHQTDLGDRVGDEWDRALHDNVLQTPDVRDRLTNPGLDRIEQWDVALNAFHDSPFHGEGAGTYALRWNRDRSVVSQSLEGHSLYLENLGELGVVGMALLGISLLAIVIGTAIRLRGPDRGVYAALLAAGLAWLLHAAVDLDWEEPTITIWLFALGGAALALPKGPRANIVPGAGVRVGLVASCVALGLIPALLAVSQARLVQSQRAYDRGDCTRAVDTARSSISALSNRPEPYEIAAYCESRSGSRQRSLATMKQAVDRDPDNWRYHYGVAMVLAAAGRDPRPRLREALRLSPREPVLRRTRIRVRGRDPRRWRAAARKAGLRLPRRAGLRVR
jgi:O-antigen ligase/polysaccharide polymerase Wzy-like membrane protein